MLIKHILFLTVRDSLPDAAAPVGHSGAEVMDAGGLVKTSQTPLIILQFYIVYFIQKYIIFLTEKSFSQHTLPSLGSYALMCLMWCLESLRVKVNRYKLSTHARDACQ